ncbi:hypothetical protein V6N13_128477 [Hibiscus sabdariffa]
MLARLGTFFALPYRRKTYLKSRFVLPCPVLLCANYLSGIGSESFDWRGQKATVQSALAATSWAVVYNLRIFFSKHSSQGS